MLHDNEDDAVCLSFAVKNALLANSMRLSLQCDDLVLALHSSFEKALVFAI
jgi:hypothetical protein